MAALVSASLVDEEAASIAELGDFLEMDPDYIHATLKAQVCARVCCCRRRKGEESVLCMGAIGHRIGRVTIYEAMGVRPASTIYGPSSIGAHSYFRP